MNYNINIREECFGATVMNLQNGQREYITKNELNDVLDKGIFPKDSIIQMMKSEHKIKFTPLEEKNPNHFSFADIAYIEVTRACNLRCKHCLNNSGEVMKNQLCKEDFLKLISDFANEGIQEIRFTGGEPLVHKNIFEFIEYAHNLGLYTSIGTNGTLITEDIAKKLTKVGLNMAIVSVDGTMEAHDKIRGNGSFNKTINGIKNLKKYNIEVRVNAVVMKSNIDDIVILAKDMHKNKTSLFIRRFIESGRGAFLKGHTLNKKDYDKLREKLAYELENGKYINGHYLRNDEKIKHRIELPFKFIKGCKAGQRAIIITPDGKIHLCGFLAAQGFEAVGNVKEVKNWREYWHNSHNVDYLKFLRENLDGYNELPGVQQTNCLAYVQRYLNNKE
ncbi:MAG: radical SAM protein [Clostridia bacterium]|nr:radical SAM protein [Clostridia bacterium]